MIDADTDPAAWDSCATTNPAFVRDAEGRFRLYYKGFGLDDWNHDIRTGALTPGTAAVGQRTNRRYGLAISDRLEGPYYKHPDNPLVDFSALGGNAQCEDAYVWLEDGRYHMIQRDMGYWNHEYGLIFTSADGLRWGEPEIAFWNSHRYFDEPSNGLEREGRLERPQLLMNRDGRPDFLFTALRGGRYCTSSGAVLRIQRGNDR